MLRHAAREALGRRTASHRDRHRDVADARIDLGVARTGLPRVRLDIIIIRSRAPRGDSRMVETAASSADPAQRRRRPAAAGQAVADAASGSLEFDRRRGGSGRRLPCRGPRRLGRGARLLRRSHQRVRGGNHYEDRSDDREQPLPRCAHGPHLSQCRFLSDVTKACARLFLRFSLNILRTMKWSLPLASRGLNVEQQWLPVQLREHGARGGTVVV